MKRNQSEGLILDDNTVVEGLRLTAAETKILDCLCKMLHDRSENKDPKSEDYYSGNKGYEMVPFGQKRAKAPILSFSLYEITKEYKGGENISGKDQENVREILQGLTKDTKRFLLSYTERYYDEKGEYEEVKVEEFKTLIHELRITNTKYTHEEGKKSTVNLVYLLNPIFIRQIDSHFLLYPADIIKRTIIAYGSHNVSEITLKLRDWLMEKKKYDSKAKISLDRLYYVVAEKWMNESRKKRVAAHTQKALEAVKTLGLLKSYEIKPGQSGELVIHFNINKEFE